jgi:ABC-2 type transport system ATP-binding protein
MTLCSTIAIDAQEVFKSYDDSQILSGINLQIESGDFYVLMGPNGSGKSTLLSIIAGTNTFDSGAVRILKSDIGEDRLGARKHIGYVPQESFCSEFLTGRENLLYFAGLLGLSKSEAKQKIDRLLEMMDLREHANRRVSEYSGGMKKKLEVATALLGEVQILLLDEPSTGLDPNVRKDFLTLLKEINKQGTAILLVTHIGEDAEMASHVGFMVNGEIVIEGSPEELKKMSGFRNSIIVDAAPRSEELMLMLASLSEDCIVTEAEDGFVLTCENTAGMVPRIVEAIRTMGHEVLRIDTRTPSLEDIFYRLTNYRIRGEAQ